MGCGQSKATLQDITSPGESSTGNPVIPMQQQQPKQQQQPDNDFIEGEKDVEEIQSASTLQLESPNHSRNNNNNNNSKKDFTDSSNTVVIGQKVPPTQLLQTIDSTEKKFDPGTPLATSPGAGNPRMRRISICLDGAVVLESTFMVDSNNHPTCTLTPHDSRPGSHDGRPGSHDSRTGSHDKRPGSLSQHESHDRENGSHDIKPESHDSTRDTRDKDSEAVEKPPSAREARRNSESETDTGMEGNSKRTTESHKGTLQARTSAYLEIPPTLSDLAEEKLAMAQKKTV